MLRRRIAGTRARGVSLVELMVGVTIGLIVVAAASMLVATQLTDNRRLVLETQVQQDLRATADIIARELRRSGHWLLAESVVANPATGPSVRNSFLTVSTSSCPPSSLDICFNYRRPDGATGPFGYKLVNGVIRTQLSISTGLQDLTDVNVLVVDSMTVAVTTLPAPPVRLPCPKLCPDGSRDCWPTLAVRDVTVTIKGHAVSDARVARTVTSRVRLRNDQLLFAAGDPADPQACPA